MPAEADEDRERRAQLGEELAAAGREALVDRRQEPRPDELLGQRRAARRHSTDRDVHEQRVDDAHVPVGVAPRARRDPVAERAGPPTRSRTTSPFSA